jgi:hypothetical protein
MPRGRQATHSDSTVAKPVSHRELEAQLWQALGRKPRYLTHLVPSLARAVAIYSETETATESERVKHRDQLLRQADAAEAIRGKANSLLGVIRKKKRPIRDALSAGHLSRSFERLHVDALPWAEPPVLADLLGRWGAADRAVETVVRLVAEAKQWEGMARVEARQRPGMKSGIRSSLAMWVGNRLAREGIRPTTTKSGCWARVLIVMNAAVRIDVEPYQYRDLHAALERLRRDYPDLVGSSRQQIPHPEKRRMCRR